MLLLGREPHWLVIVGQACAGNIDESRKAIDETPAEMHRQVRPGRDPALPEVFPQGPVAVLYPWQIVAMHCACSKRMLISR